MTVRKTIPILVVAGVSSGVGKTTVTLGLLEAFRRRGLTVRAFKVGPDFIDPGFHALATGRPCYNLDGWMCTREHVVATVARHAAGADLAIVEGVMGCFDGYEASSEVGSTAEVAKWLGAPVILVVDAGALVRSAAAVVLGFERFDPALDVAGVIFNRVGGAAHRQWLHEAVGSACRARPLGALPRRQDVQLPERHLGLVTSIEGGYSEAFRRRLADALEEHVTLEALLALARSTVSADASAPVPRASQSRRADVRIGVARDLAFQFYYPDNLERLEAAGAELIFWSPLEDGALPPVDGLYVGGGYPELYGKRIAGNLPLRGAVREFVASGRPVYAECGGLMYMAESLEDPDGAVWPMVGVLPSRVRMKRGHLTLGYREVEITAPGPLGPLGIHARGHEFHSSTLEPPPESIPRIYSLRDRGQGETRAEGYLVDNALMSYVHLHFGSEPRLAESLVAACRRARDGSAS